MEAGYFSNPASFLSDRAGADERDGSIGEWDPTVKRGAAINKCAPGLLHTEGEVREEEFYLLLD